MSFFSLGHLHDSHSLTTSFIYRLTDAIGGVWIADSIHFPLEFSPPAWDLLNAVCEHVRVLLLRLVFFAFVAVRLLVARLLVVHAVVGYEHQLVQLGVDLKADCLFVPHATAEQGPRKGAHDVALHDAVEWPRAKGGVVAHVAEPGLAFVVNLKLDLAVGKAPVQLGG